MFQNGEDLRAMPLIERKKRPKAILPKHRLVAFSRHRKTFGTMFFEEAGRKGLEGIMAKRASSKYLSGARSDDWLKIKTSMRQEVVIAGFTDAYSLMILFQWLRLACHLLATTRSKLFSVKVREPDWRRHAWSARRRHRGPQGRGPLHARWALVLAREIAARVTTSVGVKAAAPLKSVRIEPPADAVQRFLDRLQERHSGTALRQRSQ
jgi:hypothetical protein